VDADRLFALMSLSTALLLAASLPLPSSPSLVHRDHTLSTRALDSLTHERSCTMVYFCPYCANMLLIEYGREGATRFYCQTCAYVCPIPRKLTKTFHLKRKAVDDVLGDDAWVHADTEQSTSLTLLLLPVIRHHRLTRAPRVRACVAQSHVPSAPTIRRTSRRCNRALPTSP